MSSFSRAESSTSGQFQMNSSYSNQLIFAKIIIRAYQQSTQYQIVIQKTKLTIILIQNLQIMLQQNQFYSMMQSHIKESTSTELSKQRGSSRDRQRNQAAMYKNSFFEQCRNILKKPHEGRTPAENQLILRITQKNQFLKEVVDVQGLDFVKGILKHAKIQFVNEGQVIVEQDQPLNYMVVILEGKLGVEKPSFVPNQQVDDKQSKQMKENLSLKVADLIEKLTLLAKKERDQMRKVSKFQRKTSFPVSEYQFVPPILSSNDFAKATKNIQKIIVAHQQYGGKQRLNSSCYKSRVFATEHSILLIFQMNFLFYWLEAAFKVKMTKNIQRFKTVPPFEIIEDEKISEIIMSMKITKRRKNDVIYRQGQQAETLYFLLQGELKISKEVDLFKENPNDFYVDRRRLLRHIHNNAKQTQSRSIHNNHDDQVLHFANLTKVYNYRPVKKSIEVGVLASFGMFGEEEVIFQTKRQATIQVNSIEAVYYQIEFKKILQIIGNKMVQKFKQALEVSMSKKILYRQHQMADQIDLQNRAHMNYFFVEEGKTLESPRRIKLQKINQKVIPQTSRDNTDHAPAFYTTFNFNKMLDNKRYAFSASGGKSKQITETIDETFQPPIYNQTEEKLIGISHTWNPIEKKVKQEKFVSRKISPIKHQINISEPLIDQQFFKDVAKQQRRINKEFRTIRLSLGKRSK